MHCRLALIGAALACAAGCRDRASAPAPATAATSPHKRELLALYDVEEQLRRDTDFATLPPSDVALGADPYRIARVRDGVWCGLLRGESAVVLLDERGHELARAAAPRSPSGLAVLPGGDVLVVGDGARDIARFATAGDHLAQTATIAAGALGMRDIALAPDARTAYVVEERTGRTLAVPLAGGAPRELGRCHGPISVQTLGDVVATDCLLDHAIEIRRGSDVARVHHDGPIWSVALHREPDGSLLVAAGGVEDHPLVRADGGFGYIDSYVYLYRLARTGEPQRLAAINTSALGTITPKWLAIARRADGALAVTTAGYASAKLLELTWRGDLAAAPTIAQRALLPGTAAAVLAADGTLLAANPLLDAWIVSRGDAASVVAVASPPGRPARSLPSRVGELLFFTSAMAPWNSSDGELSRFTCETCHYEGYVDGRVHFTGRDRVHATTRPLLGLANNRPYFSRALDETMTQMVHSEFKVANRHNGRDPWFGLSPTDVPWLATAGVPARSPEQLRGDLMRFLFDFSHRSNPAATDHARFTDAERAGARVFRDRCASCHAGRLIADEPASQVPFERWEALVLSPSGGIVWSNAARAKTGVEPYVHGEGTRVPALRRLYKKWPYFTNGSASTLADVLDRFAGEAHDGAPATAQRLSADDKRALLAFLDLL